MVEDNQAIYHGAWPKTIRIHTAITGLKEARKMQNWRMAYQFSEDLYTELYNWVPEKLNEEYLKAWSAYADVTNLVLHGTGGRVVRDRCSTLSLNFFLLSMQVMKEANLDTPMKNDDYMGSLV